MRVISLLRSLWANLVHRDRIEAALRDELDAYVDLVADEYARDGMPRDEARRAALVAARGTEHVKESVRDAWVGNAIAVGLRELRFVLRSLRRSPGFVVIGVATLGIGIGGVTAIFTIIDAALLRPLPVAAEPDRLISAERSRVGSSELDDVSYQDYVDFRTQPTTLAGLAAYNGTSMALEARSGAARAWVSYVSDNFFDVLGVRPALGRVISAADGVSKGASPVVVLGYDIWQSRFGGDSSVIGSTVKLDFQPFTVIGVAPKGFIGAMRLHRMELWIPFGALPHLSASEYFETRGWRWLRLVGRLAPGATVDGAQRELSGIASRLASAYSVDKGRDLRVFAGAGMTDDERVAASRIPRLLSIAIALLLLIACSNVANLSLVRAAAKQRELATRLALGASRGSLVRRLFVEGAVIAAGAAVVGVLIAQALVHSASIVSTVVDMDDLDLRTNWRVLAGALAIAFFTAVLVSVLPAFQVSRTQLGILIKDGGGGAVGRRSRGQRVLVVVQVAASLVLLAWAGIIYSAFQRVLKTDPGFEPRGLTYAWVDLWSAGYDSTHQVAFYRELLARAESAPGIAGAALTSTVTPAWAPHVSVFRRGEEPPPHEIGGRESERGVSVLVNSVSPSLFAVLRLPILFGRGFDANDDDRRPMVAVVSRTLAETLWPNQPAIGQYISWPTPKGPPRPPLQVVGVVADLRRASTSGSPALALYVPFAQHPSTNRLLLLRGRGSVPPAVSVPARLVAGVDQRVVVLGERTLVDFLDGEMHVPRIASAWVGVFGVIALLLASIGLYGVVAQSVHHRTRELAVRSALGATPGGLLGLVLGEGTRLAATGAAIGAIGALAGLRLLHGLFTIVVAMDAEAVAVAALALSTSMLAATYVPARRAARLNPADALRCD
jgi:predicted permease